MGAQVLWRLKESDQKIPGERGGSETTKDMVDCLWGIHIAHGQTAGEDGCCRFGCWQQAE